MKVSKCSMALVLVIVSMGVILVGGEENGNLKEECAEDFQKVIGCLEYVTGKSPDPNKECCDSIKDIKESEPKCLCFFIQQTHNGNPQIKGLGIQEVKLLQLPSVCNLKNSSISYCPKLLGIPPKSADAAIFSNSSTPTAPTSMAGTPVTPSVGLGGKIVPQFSVVVTAFAMAIFFTAFNFHSCDSHVGN